MKRKHKKGKWGGRRPGAGRKPLFPAEVKFRKLIQAQESGAQPWEYITDFLLTVIYAHDYEGTPIMVGLDTRVAAIRLFKETLRDLCNKNEGLGQNEPAFLQT
jgi:hypothetical protein